MQTSTDHANKMLRDIQNYSLSEAKTALEQFENSLEDPYDDGSDTAGDMWLSMCISACHSRIRQLGGK